MAKRVLTRTEIVKVHSLLQQHLAPSIRGEGYFNYQDDWDDGRIAREIDPTIQATSVGNARLELFGKLDTSGNSTRDDNIRIKALEDSIANLIKCIQEHKVKYEKLIDTLTINHIANVKHLK